MEVLICSCKIALAWPNFHSFWRPFSMQKSPTFDGFERGYWVAPATIPFVGMHFAIAPRLYFFSNLAILMYLIIARWLHVCAYSMTSVLSLNRSLQKDSNTESLRYHWLTFRMMRSMLTGRSDWELKMFKGGMFWQISGYVEFKWFHLLPTLLMLCF